MCIKILNLKILAAFCMIDKPVIFFVFYYYYYYYLLSLSIGISDEIEVTTIAIDEKSHDSIAILPIKFDNDGRTMMVKRSAKSVLFVQTVVVVVFWLLVSIFLVVFCPAP